MLNKDQARGVSDGLYSLACEGSSGKLYKLLATIPPPIRVNRLNQHNQYGFTPLHGAIFYDNLPNVELLLKHGADVRIPADREKWTFALNIAALQGGARLIRVLMNAGGDPFLCDWAGLTPLEIAKIAGNKAATPILKKSMESQLDHPAHPILPPTSSADIGDDWRWRVRTVKSKAIVDTASPGTCRMRVVVQDHYSDGGSPPALLRDACKRKNRNAALYRVNSQPLTLNEKKLAPLRRPAAF